MLWLQRFVITDTCPTIDRIVSFSAEAQLHNWICRIHRWHYLQNTNDGVRYRILELLKVSRVDLIIVISSKSTMDNSFDTLDISN